MLVTNYRKRLLQSYIADDRKQMILDSCNSHNWEMIAMETDKDHIYFLVSYDTTDRVCDIVKIIQQETTYYLWNRYHSFFPNNIGGNISFGLMAILLVVLEKYYQLLYKNTSRVWDNG